MRLPLPNFLRKQADHLRDGARDALPQVLPLQIAFLPAVGDIESYVPLTSYHVAFAEAILLNTDYRDFFALRRLHGAYVMVRTSDPSLNVVEAARLVRAQEIQLATDSGSAAVAWGQYDTWMSHFDRSWDGELAITLTGESQHQFDSLWHLALDAKIRVFLIGRGAVPHLHNPDVAWGRRHATEPSVPIAYHVMESAINNPIEIIKLKKRGVFRGVDTSHPFDAAVRGIQIGRAHV